jgi:hypothetical protein
LEVVPPGAARVIGHAGAGKVLGAAAVGAISPAAVGVISPAEVGVIRSAAVGVIAAASPSAKDDLAMMRIDLVLAASSERSALDREGTWPLSGVAFY